MRSRIPGILAGIYAALVVLSILLIFVGDDGLVGIYALLLGAPWTLLAASAIDAVNPALFETNGAGIGLAVVGGAINTAIVYFVSRWSARRAQTR